MKVMRITVPVNMIIPNGYNRLCQTEQLASYSNKWHFNISLLSNIASSGTRCNCSLHHQTTIGDARYITITDDDATLSIDNVATLNENQGTILSLLLANINGTLTIKCAGTGTIPITVLAPLGTKFECNNYSFTR